MNDTTRDALFALAAALLADPAGAKELDVYGDMTQHIADAIADLEFDDETDALDDDE